MNATEFCKLVENQLGWEPPQGVRGWELYRAEAAKVNRKIGTNPTLYTWENLRLAVALLRRERQSRTPIGVFAHVDRALDLALDHSEADIEEEIRKVIAYEADRGDPNGWVGRLTRATGKYRRVALEDWKHSVQ